MSKIPSINYFKLLRALQNTGFVIVRQRGSHIRLQKRTENEVIKITVPAHKTIKKSTLHQIIKLAKLDLDEFIKLI